MELVKTIVFALVLCLVIITNFLKGNRRHENKCFIIAIIVIILIILFSVLEFMSFGIYSIAKIVLLISLTFLFASLNKEDKTIKTTIICSLILFPTYFISYLISYL